MMYCLKQEEVEGFSVSSSDFCCKMINEAQCCGSSKDVYVLWVSNPLPGDQANHISHLYSTGSRQLTGWTRTLSGKLLSHQAEIGSFYTTD